MVDFAERPASLLVFSDDWGRHPSSCQHLMRELLPRRRVAWVNTIGTRAPKFDLATMSRAWEKLRQWRSRSRAAKCEASSQLVAHQPASATTNGVHAGECGAEESAAPTVLNPRMWPWFTRTFDRRLNRTLLESQLKKSLERLPRPVVAVTTLPITADLVGRLPVDAWVYYCVDDFREWPGLDGRTLGRMEEVLVRHVDRIIVVSETLRQRMTDLGRESTLLTHGCDVARWRVPTAAVEGQAGSMTVPLPPCPPAPLPSTHPHLKDLPGPIALFWGVVDRRMDTAFVRRLSERMTDGTIVLVGPKQDPDPELLALPRVVYRPAVPFDELPRLAAGASALVMPYADAPVTRAMQPLKLKEYLATGKPVVVRNLPATRDWSDSLDEATTADEFADAVVNRFATGLPHAQEQTRRRLEAESWTAKARQFEEWIDAAVANARASSLVEAVS